MGMYMAVCVVLFLCVWLSVWEGEGGGGGHLLHSVLGEGLPIAHGYIDIRQLPSCFELGCNGLGLLIGDPSQRRATPNGPVALHALGSPQR